MLASAFVYILTNEYHTTLYIGVTTDLYVRVWEHQTKQNPRSFTARYNVTKLIYYESFDSIAVAIRREKYLKKKKRCWKEDLIGTVNPLWDEVEVPG
ncbi:MAG TPA: GIY-YIG nuclease family protein [Ohtaekwangia sp.]|nr:GIY-YIG nuclease family protein [Ohtaekwangia sp.]